MTLRILFCCLIIGIMTFGFQNCSKPVAFTADAGSGLVHKIDTGIIDEDDSDGPSDEDGNGDGDSDGDDDNGLAGEHIYVCILEGPGSSVRLGLDGDLKEVGNTINEVCMSKSACLDIISQKFDVKKAEKRGFCPDRNKHVVELEDAAIQDLVNKL